MHDPPGPVNVHTVIGNKAAFRQRTIALRPEVLSQMTNRRLQRRLGLKAVFARHSRVRHCGLVSGIDLFGAVKCILQSDDGWWSCRSLRLHELERGSRLEILRGSERYCANNDQTDKQNVFYSLSLS